MDGYRGERRGSHSAADPAAFFIGYRPGVPDSAAWAQVVTLTRRRRPWSSSARRSTGGARNYTSGHQHRACTDRPYGGRGPSIRSVIPALS